MFRFLQKFWNLISLTAGMWGNAGSLSREAHSAKRRALNCVVKSATFHANFKNGQADWDIYFVLLESGGLGG